MITDLASVRNGNPAPQLIYLERFANLQAVFLNLGVALALLKILRDSNKLKTAFIEL